MVLRGSKIHPQYDAIQVSTAIEHAKQYLHQAEEEIEEVEHEITEIVHHELDHLREGIPPIDPESASVHLDVPADLTSSIAILVHRLEELEKKHHEAEETLQTYQKELRISLQQLACGGLAGATARTIVAPIDRVKLLIQTARTVGNVNRGVLGTAMFQVRENGVKSLWKGNFTNCLRVFPYAAIQFAAYDRYKSIVINWTEENNREFGHLERLLSGGMAGATAATLTYPLDVMRVRQAVFKDIKGPVDAFRSVYAEGGARYFFKGWTPTLLSLGPFIAINFATFDFLKQTYIPDGDVRNAPAILTLGLGAGAGLFAQTFCYPLDTIRRNMQMPGKNFSGIADCVMKVVSQDGIVGMYRGIIPNALKIIPNNGIRFMAFNYLTAYFGIPQAKKRR